MFPFCVWWFMIFCGLAQQTKSPPLHTCISISTIWKCPLLDFYLIASIYIFRILASILGTFIPGNRSVDIGFDSNLSESRRELRPDSRDVFLCSYDSVSFQRTKTGGTGHGAGAILAGQHSS